MANEVPEILYKYRRVCDKSISMLQENKIYFANPKDFNDPFDCKAREDTVKSFREAMENFFRKNAEKKGLSRDEIEATIETMRQHPKMVESEAETDAAEDEFKKFIEYDLGIVSLSSHNNSILMWSHYADFHRGFCIGFNTAKSGFPPGTINEVIYTSTINKDFELEFFLSEDTSEERYMRETLKMYILTKYQDWSYEKEWRIMGVTGEGTYLPAMIREIIFGLNCSDEDKIKIKGALRDKEISYFQAFRGVNDFSIDIKPI